MEIQNYCMVNEQTSICENIILWDGNSDNWQPPEGYLLLLQSATPAKNWVRDATGNQWVLSVSGEGQVGFLWDGTYLTTNETQPNFPANQSILGQPQPSVDGAQTL